MDLVSAGYAEATPGETLSKKTQTIRDQSGIKVKVVERGGRTVKQFLQKSDVCPNSGCGKTDCWLSATDGSNGVCHRENVGYCIESNVSVNDEKTTMMNGETGWSGRKSVGQLCGRETIQVCMECHEMMSCKVTGCFNKDPLSQRLMKL